MAKMTTSLLMAVALVATAGCTKKRPVELPPGPGTEQGPGVNDVDNESGAGRLNE
jgi:peptidoglycan-associated lipoprotein